ncbi:MAG TPA: AAA domain-containing protein [Ktedonobacteraceae bacterium]|nr:AAA domain-containing protein [Ktedonobacteraceae bacterium]
MVTQAIRTTSTHLPITLFFLPCAVEQRLVSSMGDSAASEATLTALQALLHNEQEPAQLLVYVCWQNKAKGQIGIRFPHINALASWRFLAHAQDGATCIDNIVPVTFAREISMKQCQHYETRINCLGIFSAEVPSDDRQLQTLHELLLKEERLRRARLEGRTLLNMEYLDAAIATAKSQSFTFTTVDCTLLHSGMLEIRLSEKDNKRCSEQLLMCADKKRKISLVLKGKKAKKKRKQIYYPFSIQHYEAENGVLLLKTDDTNPVPDALLRTLATQSKFEFNPIGDLTIQRDALTRLLTYTRLPGVLPLDLFLFGDNEELVNAIPPLSEEDLQTPIQRYLRDDLNEEQKQAIQLALATPDFFLLQGPPGTGKTTFIAELCYQIVQQGGVVLIASQTNLAVDNALSRLAEHADILAVRIGNQRKMHEIGLEFVEGSAVRRWLASIVDGVKADLEALRYFFELYPLFVECWEDIQLHYQSFISKQELDLCALQAQLMQVQQQCLSLQECEATLAATQQLLDIAQEQCKALQTQIKYGSAQNSLQALQIYWQRYYDLIPTAVKDLLHWHEEGIPYYEDIVEMKKNWEYVASEGWDIHTLARRISILEDWLAALQQDGIEVPKHVWEMFLQNANVYGTTCVHSGTYGFLNTITNIRKKGFDYVIIDEVSKASANELLIPCLFGKKIILVGDHKQLPPLIHSEMAEQLHELAKKYADNDDQVSMNLKTIQRHFFSAFFAERFEYLSQRAPHYQRTLMLTRQYRMHSQIMGTINQFYNGALTQGCRDEEREHFLEICWWLPNSEAHLAWIDTSPNKYWIHQQEGESRLNQAEAFLIIGVLKDIIDKLGASSSQCQIRPLEIGIISVYRAQTNLLQSLYKQQMQDVPADILVEFGTVDAFQGREQDIILLSLVLNDKNTMPSSFLADPRRINVAMSRARRLLLIFGSTHNYTGLKGEARKFYQKILSVAKSLRTHVGVRFSTPGEEK